MTVVLLWENAIQTEPTTGLYWLIETSVLLRLTHWQVLSSLTHKPFHNIEGIRLTSQVTILKALDTSMEIAYWMLPSSSP